MDLSSFDNSGYDRGAGFLRRAAWYLCNAFVFAGWWLPFSAPKRGLLRLFGARIGRGVVIKPRVNIKQPWRLAIGDHSWIGEAAWIDNLARVDIGSNVCVSQGACLLTGNHDYRSEAFTLVIGAIQIGDGAWIGARSTVCPGVTIAPDCVLVVGSIARADTERGWVYHGSPAAKLRPRWPAPIAAMHAGGPREAVAP